MVAMIVAILMMAFIIVLGIYIFTGDAIAAFAFFLVLKATECFIVAWLVYIMLGWMGAL